MIHFASMKVTVTKFVGLLAGIVLAAYLIELISAIT